MTIMKVGSIVVLCLTMVVGTAPAAPPQNPRIAPIQSKPHGKSYSEWAAEWWQWFLETPASVNPVLDLTGEHCAESQSGKVWFLAGAPFGVETVERRCTVRPGTALFFPLINAFYGAFLNDPEEQRTEEFLRQQVACSGTVISAQIDGVEVRNPLQYFEQSPLFDVQLPQDNIFGVDEDVVPDLLLSPSVDEGYYLFLQPLSRGQHTLYWQASQSCPFGDFTQDVTYHLTIR